MALNVVLTIIGVSLVAVGVFCDKVQTAAVTYIAVGGALACINVNQIVFSMVDINTVVADVFKL